MLTSARSAHRRRTGHRDAQHSRNDSGSALIEFLGVIPFAVLVAGFILQMFLIGYGAISAESSARFAARQQALGTSNATIVAMVHDRAAYWNPQVTLRDGDFLTADTPGAPDALEPQVTSTGDSQASSAKVTVTVRFLGFGVAPLDIAITRFAVMPSKAS